MTSAHSQPIDPASPGFFHCFGRCVRRAFRSGFDSLSGRDFEHRKARVETRRGELAECFAVGIYAWAKMSNHFHVMVHVDPAGVAHWSADERLGLVAMVLIDCQALNAECAHEHPARACRAAHQR